MSDEDFNIDDFFKNETEYLDIMDYARNTAPKMSANYPSFVEGEGQDAIANFYIDNNGEKIVFCRMQMVNGMYYLSIRLNFDNADNSWLSIEGYELDGMIPVIENSYKIYKERNKEENDRN